MAIYHANIKSFSRGKGESSVAAAAYRAGIDLIDTTKHIDHRYSQRKGVRAFHMLAPKGAPDWCRDARVFWDANEAWETRANARVARELEVALPSELTDDQRECLALALGQELVDRFQAVVLVAVHEPSAAGDQRNHHVHLLMSARKVGPEGLGERAGSEFDARLGKGADAVREVREWVGTIINDHLHRAGMQIRVDHRSLKDQALEAAVFGDLDKARELDRPATKHIGKFATAMARKAVAEAAKLSIFGLAEGSKSSEASFNAAVEKAQREGRLALTPNGHSHVQARAESNPKRKQPEFGAHTPASILRRQSWPRKQAETSPVGLHLSRSFRLARVQGFDAEVLNAQAEVIEAWVKTQQEIAQMTIDALRVMGNSFQFEPEFDAAIEELRTPRLHIYCQKTFFFDDTEALTRAVRDYGVAMRAHHDALNTYTRARAKASEAERATGRLRHAQLRAAKAKFHKARLNVSDKAKAGYDSDIRKARAAMVEATVNLSKKYHITKLNLTPEEKAEDTKSGGPAEGESSRGMRLEPKRSPPVRWR